MKHEESNLQISCVTWFRYQYPELRLNLFSVPNGGHRRIETAVWMQKEGSVSGVSDLILLAPSKGLCALLIELKIKPNKQSKNQIEFQKATERLGCYKYIVCYTLEQFRYEISDYFKS